MTYIYTCTYCCDCPVSDGFSMLSIIVSTEKIKAVQKQRLLDKAKPVEQMEMEEN